MFTKEELQLVNAILSSEINLPVKFAPLVVSIRSKIETELHDNKNESAENVSGAQDTPVN